MLTELEFHIDRLYQLPPGEFTAGRNALAVRVKKDGDAAAAARVRALEKPSASAWAVNQLYWRARPDFDAIVAVGDRVRAGQVRLLAGHEVADFQDAFEERLRAMGRALKTIDGLAARSGVDLSPPVRRRIQTTVEAIASLGSSGERPFDGRLAGDLTPPGFEALAALAASPVPPAAPRASKAAAAKPRPDDAQRREAATRLSRARSAVAAAESDLKAATADAARADAAVEAADRRAGEARDDAAAARRQLTDAMARSARALDALKEARRRQAKASAARDKAGAALRAARAALARLAR
jgi:hypothetical protein